MIARLQIEGPRMSDGEIRTILVSSSTVPRVGEFVSINTRTNKMEGRVREVIFSWDEPHKPNPVIVRL